MSDTGHEGFNAQGANALEALRALHGGAGAPVDPLIWLAICAGLLAAIVCVFAARANLFRLPAVRRATHTALASTRDLPVELRHAEQAKVLRRVARTLGSEDQARLRGEAWLGALDHFFRTRYFTQGEGRYFADDLYRANNAHDPDAMARRLEHLARRLRP
jgi:hypothetical protein